MTIDMNRVLERDENLILLAARMVREHYFPNREGKLPDWILIFAIRDILKSQNEISPRELFDLLVTQSKLKAQGHLSRYLAGSVAASINGRREANVFTGAREFSIVKIAAMASNMTYRGQNLCKTKLNKLLFYSDFVHYFLYGYSISGARYIRHHSGPLMDQYDSIFKTLVFGGILEVKNGYGNEQELVANGGAIKDNLTILEMVTMDWVLTNFGSMTAYEISRHSNREIAYRFTGQDDYIAYEYAKILQRLPDKSQL